MRSIGAGYPREFVVNFQELGPQQLRRIFGRHSRSRSPLIPAARLAIPSGSKNGHEFITFSVDRRRSCRSSTPRQSDN